MIVPVTTLPLGPVTLLVDARPPWDGALIDLLADWRPGPPTKARRIVTGLASATLDGARPRLPRFSGDARVLTDRSEAWDARISLASPVGLATFELHDGALEPHVRRELVAAALRVTLATVAPDEGALLVHAAAAGRESAIAFVGPSGEGKTTIARRLREAGWTTLSDDAVLVTPESVAATPLRGKENEPRVGGPRPLRALVFLAKGSEALRLEPMSPAEATAALFPRVFWYAAAPQWEARVMDVIARVVERVPAYRLCSSLGHDVVPLLDGLL